MMKAWCLDRLGGMLELVCERSPRPGRGSLLGEVEAVLLPSYIGNYDQGD